MKKTAISVLIAVALFICCNCATAKTVTLAHSFKPGEIDKYKLTMDLKMAVSGIPELEGRGLNLKMISIFRQKVLGIKQDGSAKVHLTYSDVKVSCPQLPELQSKPVPSQSMIIILAKDGRMLGIEQLDNAASGRMPGMDYSSLAGQFGYYGIFPSVPVQVGQGWECKIPLPFDCGTMNVDSELLAAAIPLGKETVSKIKQTYSAYMDFSSLMKSLASSSQVSSCNLNLGGGMQITGWTVLYFSPTKGKLIKANGNAQAVFSMEMPGEVVKQGGPSRMDMNMDMVINIAKI